MKNAKRLLVLLFAFALVFTVAFSFASCSSEPCNHADSNGDGKCDSCNVSFDAALGCVHVDADKNAKCDKCNSVVACKVHVDVNKDASCDVCGAEIACAFHIDTDKNIECDVCGESLECTSHVDADKNAQCDVCGVSVDCIHVDADKDASCDVCGESVTCKVHTDVNKNAECDVCGEKLECISHVDKNKDAKCDVCKTAIECNSHVDANKDAKCDVCKAKINCKAHVDTDKDASCDVCGTALKCTVHIDADKDGLCDVCDALVDCKVHIDADKDSYCDVCLVYLPCVNHVDIDKNSECDVCGAVVICTSHFDSDKNGKCDVCSDIMVCTAHTDVAPRDTKCDVCGERVECVVHVDTNKDAKCDVCEAKLPCVIHEDIAPKNNRCDVCGEIVACKIHTDIDENSVCDICGDSLPCKSHFDFNGDTACDRCGAYVPCTSHVDEDKNAKCDICNIYVECSSHVDTDRNAKCDVCGTFISCAIHSDSNKDYECDICGKILPCATHSDSNGDLICDVCGEYLPCVSHVDADKNALCDVCGEFVPCTTHTDADKNSICDVCGETIPCTTHVDVSPKDATCDVCGKYVPCVTHVDVYPRDAKCDVCGTAVACTSHIDNSPKDAVCDICGQVLPCTTHVDANKDSKCDVCGTDVACDHVDTDSNRVCDLCGEELPCTSHIDEDGNKSCDVCGEELPCDHVDEDPRDTACDICGRYVPCTSHVDKNRDGECDVCGASVPVEEIKIPLVNITDEYIEPNFQIIVAKNTTADVRSKISAFVARVKTEYGIEIPMINEGTSADVEKEIEVLIGDVANRGDEYLFDRYTLGEKGYIIKVVNTKILINAGSDKTLPDAIDIFADDILGLADDSIFEGVVVTEKDTIVEIQSDYKITSLSVNGINMRDFVIVTDLSRKYYDVAATYIQNRIYNRVGYWLKIVDSSTLSEYPENAIILQNIPKVSGRDSFKISAEGSRLYISCAYDNMLENATAKFITKSLIEGRGDVNYESTVYSQDISVVYYEDFGAVGDGVTDDFDAIYRTHKFANECGQLVMATAGKTYYIFETYYRGEDEKQVSLHTVRVQTNVDWNGAEFIIDDTKLGFKSSDEYYGRNGSIFTVVPNDSLAMIKITDREVLDRLVSEGINCNTTKIDIEIEGWDGPIMIIPYNNNHTVYRRRGYGGFMGDAMHEVIVLDSEGNVSEETPIMFDYTNINYVEVYRLDPTTAITLKNGLFTTKASGYNCINYDANGKASTSSPYVSRNIKVTRSYTTVENVKHYVTDEPTLREQVDSSGNIILVAPTYTGFFYSGNANHVTFKNCVISGRRCYPRPEGGTGGTYDISGYTTNMIVFDGCIMQNFWVTVDKDDIIRPATEDTPNAVPSMASSNINGKSLKMHWGCGGTNFCKNMRYLNSTLSRFDAHQGLYNGMVINSTVNYLAITGNGDFIIENSRWFAEGPSYGSNALFHLRSDYGSTWNGNIYLKNVQAYVYTDLSTSLVYHSFQNWYFGYISGFPTMSIDNLDYYNIRTRQPLDPGFEIYYCGSVNDKGVYSTTTSKSSKMHLPEYTSPTVPIYDGDNDGFVDEPILDLDGDGVIDPPFDLDGDGVAGNTSLPYQETYDNAADYRDGVLISGTKRNVNMIKPPEYLKIINNDGVDGTGGYVYVVVNTAERGDISDGGYYDDIETWGGFFGDTKFYYSDDEYFLGPNHVDQTKTTTFKFQ